VEIGAIVTTLDWNAAALSTRDFPLNLHTLVIKSPFFQQNRTRDDLHSELLSSAASAEKAKP
jgi:hypothetical protein